MIWDWLFVPLRLDFHECGIEILSDCFFADADGPLADTYSVMLDEACIDETTDGLGGDAEFLGGLFNAQHGVDLSLWGEANSVAFIYWFLFSVPRVFWALQYQDGGKALQPLQTIPYRMFLDTGRARCRWHHI